MRDRYRVRRGNLKFDRTSMKCNRNHLKRRVKSRKSPVDFPKGCDQGGLC